MSIPGTVVEQSGNLYRIDQETYVYYDTVVTQQTKTDYTGFDDVSICRPKLLYFKAVGLRPNTRHFVYFDKVDVSNYINTSISNVTEFRTLARNDPKRNPGEKYIQESGFPTELGGPTTPILSDASGTIEGVFYLQSNNILSFPTGRRIMSFIDINILIPESALSFATATFTVDAGIENYATSYYTTSSQVAKTGTKNNLTFIAPVIKEAVINNITNEYITEITNEYVTNNYTAVTNNITNTYVPGSGTGNPNPVVVPVTVVRDPDRGSGGGVSATSGGTAANPPGNAGGGRNPGASGISVSGTATGNVGVGARGEGRGIQPGGPNAGAPTGVGGAQTGGRGATPGGGGGTGGPGNVGGGSAGQGGTGGGAGAGHGGGGNSSPSGSTGADPSGGRR